MKFVINKEMSILDSFENRMLLQNKANDKLFEISKDEYECLVQYTYLSNEAFKNLIEESNYDEKSKISILNFIELAKEKQILVEENYLSFSNRNLPKFLFYLSLLFPFLDFLFIYNNSIYKIFEFKNFNKVIQIISLFTLVFAYLSSIYLMKDLADYPSTIKIWILILFISSSSMFHELGHLISYKLFQGKSERIGFGLMYYFYPILYTNTPSLYFWGNVKYKKIGVSLSGSLFDCITLLLSLSINNYLGFYIILFRIIQNLNPLIPLSDGYFILKDFKNVILFESLINHSRTYFDMIQLNIKNVFDKKIIYFLLLNLIRIIILAIYFIFIYKCIIKELAYYFILN